MTEAAAQVTNKKESKIVTICDNCRAVQIKGIIWLKYSFFFNRLYEKLTDGCVGIIYEPCPLCAYGLRR